MRNFMYRIYSFLYGRYGIDALNIFMLVTATIINLINRIFFKNSFYLAILVFIILSLILYRSLSKNLSKRNKENYYFKKIVNPFSRRVKVLLKQYKDKNNKYYLCPQCKQIVRVPRKRGKIKITCPTCHEQFIRKT